MKKLMTYENLVMEWLDDCDRSIYERFSFDDLLRAAVWARTEYGYDTSWMGARIKLAQQLRRAIYRLRKLYAPR